jgi:hypothetical protein
VAFFVEVSEAFAEGVGFFFRVVVFFSVFFVALGLGVGLVDAASARLRDESVNIRTITSANFFMNDPI